jgi:hypothetical protein
MPVHINPDDDGWVPMITFEDTTHVVISIEVPKAELKKMARFIQALLTIAVQ